MSWLKPRPTDYDGGHAFCWDLNGTQTSVSVSRKSTTYGGGANFEPDSGSFWEWQKFSGISVRVGRGRKSGRKFLWHGSLVVSPVRTNRRKTGGNRGKRGCWAKKSLKILLTQSWGGRIPPVAPVTA